MSPAFSAVVPETHGEPSSEAAVPRTRFSQTLELPPVLIGASESARQRAYSREAWSSRPSSGPLDSHGPNDSVGGTSKQARSSAFTVAKSDEKGKELRERLAFTEAIEPGMQDYLLDSCAEGMNGWLKAGQTIGLILSLLVLLPALSFFPALIPFPKPDAGFRENWRFNFITHPILNYVCSRAALELFARSTEPSQRYRVRWIVIGIPFVGVLACLLIHIVASSFGLYPVPYAAVSSCIPSIILCVMVASRLIPADLRTSEVRMFRNFNLVCWVSWAFQFGVLMLWLLAFPVLSPGWQLVGSFMVTTMLAGVGFAQERLGRWMGLPWYIATEVKVFILFIAFLFTAALLSAAKSITILIAMAIQDAGKALAIFGNMCFHLVSLCEAESRDEEQATEADGRDPACGACCKQMQLVSSGQFLTSARQKWSTALALRRRLREIFSRCEIQTREGLQATTLPVADVRLLSHFTRYVMVFALVEICEVLVPVIYIIVLTLLNRPGVHPNREYFIIFSDGNYEDAIFSNTMAFLIEAIVLLWMQIMMQRSLGFNLLHFAGIVLKSEFWYWTFALGTCCVAWTTVLIAHTGHDLVLIRSWLVPSLDTQHL